MPQKSAGWRTEPPVSLPRETIQRPACTATAEPPDEPPGTRDSSAAFNTFPYTEFSLAEPIANSSQLQTPMIIASSCKSFSMAVAEYSEVKFFKMPDAAVRGW